jgi:hypothetical protein
MTINNAFDDKESESVAFGIYSARIFAVAVFSE